PPRRRGRPRPAARAPRPAPRRQAQAAWQAARTAPPKLTLQPAARYRRPPLQGEGEKPLLLLLSPFTGGGRDGGAREARVGSKRPPTPGSHPKPSPHATAILF